MFFMLFASLNELIRFKIKGEVKRKMK